MPSPPCTPSTYRPDINLLALATSTDHVRPGHGGSPHRCMLPSLRIAVSAHSPYRPLPSSREGRPRCLALLTGTRTADLPAPMPRLIFRLPGEVPCVARRGRVRSDAAVAAASAAAVRRPHGARLGPPLQGRGWKRTGRTQAARPEGSTEGRGAPGGWVWSPRELRQEAHLSKSVTQPRAKKNPKS